MATLPTAPRSTPDPAILPNSYPSREIVANLCRVIEDIERPFPDVESYTPVGIAASAAKAMARNNHLMYVKTSIKPANDDKTEPIIFDSLLDSGASKTLICYNKLSTHPQQDKFKIESLQRTVTMATALQDIGTTILGTVDLDISFPQAAQDATIRVKAYVVNGLNQKCFLGNDLLHADIVDSIRKDKLILNGSKVSPKAEKTLINVPIIRTPVNHQVTLLSLEDVYPEEHMQWIACQTEGEPPPAISVSYGALDVECPRQDDGSFFIPVLHDGDFLPAASTISTGTIKSYLGDPVVTVSDDSWQADLISCSGASLKYDYDNIFDGVINYPESSLLPAEEDDDPRLTDEEMLDSVDMSHLPEDERRKYRDLLRINLDVFSRNSTDIPEARVQPAEVEVREGKDPADFQVKYIPIAKNLREGAHKLLLKLLQAGIIRQATRPVPCLSNCFVIKKPNSDKLRLILDGRCTNTFLQRYAAATTYTLDEILSKLSNRIVSLADLSQSFFQLPLHEDAKQYFAFQGPDRRIYQLNRCSQGFHNSPLYLNLAVNAMLEIPASSTEVQFQRSAAETRSRSCPPRVRRSTQSGNAHQEKVSAATPVSGKKDKQTRANQADARTHEATKPAATLANYSSSGRTLGISSDLPNISSDNAPISLFSCYDDLAATSMETGGHDLHRRSLQLMFNKLRAANMRLKLQKMQLSPEIITILGMHFDRKYLHIPPKRFDAWRNLPIDTPRKVKGFVASTSYFRSFSKSFSRLAKPLLDLAKLPSFTPKPEHEQDREALLRNLEENSKRRTISQEDTLMVSTDASHDAAAAVLEVIDGDRTEAVTAFSRLFTKQELPHDIFAKEAATLVAALKNFSYYLMGCKNIIIRTDVRAILYIRATENRNQTSFRLATELAKYNPTIIHTPSAVNAVQDYLSRAHTDEPRGLDDGTGLSPAEASALIRNLFIEHGRTFTRAEAVSLIDAEAMRTLVAKSKERFGLKPPSFVPPRPTNHSIVRPNFVQSTPGNASELWRKKKPKPSVRTKSTPHVVSSNLVTIAECYEPDASGEHTDGQMYSESLTCFASTCEALHLEGAEHLERRPERLANDLLLLRVAEKSLRNGSMSNADFRSLQDADPEIRWHLIKTDKPKISETGLILHAGRIYLPNCLVRHAVQALHLADALLHTPRATVLRKLSAKFFRKNLKREVYNVYAECFVCAMSSKTSLPKPKLHAHFAPTSPREAFYIDVMDIKPKHAAATKAPRYAIIAVDAYSNYTIIAPMENRSKECIQATLVRHVLAPFGCPKMIISDNESAVTSDFIQNVLRANGIECHLNSPLAPWANKAERLTQSFKKFIAGAIYDGQDYTSLLPAIMHEFNSTPFTKLRNVSPELLFFSAALDRANDPLLPETRQTLAADKSMQRIKDAQTRLLQLRSQKRAQANRARKERRFKPGELVFLREPKLVPADKIVAPAGKLHIVRKRADAGAYWLDDLATKATTKRHAMHIFPAEISERAQLLSPSWDGDISAIYREDGAHPPAE